MSELAVLIPVAAITIGPLAWVANNWIRARHGYEPESRRRLLRQKAEGDLAAERQIGLLSTENEGLKGKVVRLEERIAVLERIATDPAERTAREIDQLR
jgi:hypothetical protein